MKERIAESAFNQILKFGLRKFTIDDITADLGISKKTVYKYFDSKNQIIERVLDNYVDEELNKQTEVMAQTDSFHLRFEALVLPSGKKPIPTWLLAELQQYFPELWERCAGAIQITHNHIIQIYAEGIQNGEIRSEVPPAVIDLVVKNAIDGVLDYRFLAENDIGLLSALEGVKNMVLYGIVARDKNSGGEE